MEAYCIVSPKFGFKSEEKSPIKNIMNMTTTEAIVVFLASRKTVEKKTEVDAMVPRCNVAKRKAARSLSQCNPYSRNVGAVLMPKAMNMVVIAKIAVMKA